jgi:predicted methyltransferase
MARYGDILTGGIDAVGPEALKRVLATLSALGTINADDQEVGSRIVRLAGIPLPDYLRLREQLRTRGILIEQNGRVRVTKSGICFTGLTNSK